MKNAKHAIDFHNLIQLRSKKFNYNKTKSELINKEK